MANPLQFSDLLRLIAERSDAFRTAVAEAPSLEAQVPTCPGWTLLDLVRHLGSGQRRWAATVAAGPADGPSAVSEHVLPPEREALLTWWDESTEQLLSALREHGPDRVCWTWWEGSESPATSGAVARHRLQEVAVHTYDAQLTAGAAEPLPDGIALDGVDEFLATCCAGPYAWPYQPCTLDYHATEGRSWRLALTAGDVRTTGLHTPDADAAITGTANELVLMLYGRIPINALKIDGDGHHFDLLKDWDPDAD